MTHDLPPKDPKVLAEQIINTERQAASCQQGAYNKLVEELNDVNKMGKRVADKVFKIVAETDRHDGKESMITRKDSTLVITDPFKAQEAQHEAAVGTWLEAHNARVDAQNWNHDVHSTPQLYQDFLKAYYANGDAGVRKFAEEINSQNTTTIRFNVNTDRGVTKVSIAGQGLGGPRELFDYSPETVWHMPTAQAGAEGAAAGAAAGMPTSPARAAHGVDTNTPTVP